MNLLKFSFLLVGCDLEGKGRATYMASTGVFRQVLQQVFSIPILEPDEDYNRNDETSKVLNDNTESFEEFEDDDNNNEVSKEEQKTKTIDNMTDEDIDEQFENF